MAAAEIEIAVGRAFRRAFEAHPLRETNRQYALDAAREEAGDLAPDGVYGWFDDEALTFKVGTLTPSGVKEG